MARTPYPSKYYYYVTRLKPNIRTDLTGLKFSRFKVLLRPYVRTVFGCRSSTESTFGTESTPYRWPYACLPASLANWQEI